MKTEKQDFGRVNEKHITLYTMINDNGMEVSIMNYGATITSILLPENKTDKINIVCGFNTLNEYFSEDFKKNAPYFGATIGRYCATIQNSKFNDYKLSDNAGGNCLHGGVVGFDKNVWGAKIIKETKDSCAVKFMLLSPDGDQGFPGNVLASVIFSLNNSNELSFEYEATTDKLTPFSMTNHSYYNLSGFKENVENHYVKIMSDETFPLDAKGDYKSNCLNVDGTLRDLRRKTRIGDLHKALNDGAEFYYLFKNGVENDIRKVAEISYPTNNRSVEVFTTEPGMLFYTAKYTSDKLKRESGEKFGKYRAFCCESHRIPNGPNIEGVKDVFLSPDKIFKSKTVFKFTF